MKIKTSELSGRQLDWAVQLIEIGRMAGSGEHLKHWWLEEKVTNPDRFHDDWLRAGEIIEHIKGFEFKHWLESKSDSFCEAHIHNYDGDRVEFGPTLLIAVLRCYVASKLGDEV